MNLSYWQVAYSMSQQLNKTWKCIPGTQKYIPRYKAPGDLRVKIITTQGLTSGYEAIPSTMLRIWL